MDLPTLDVFKEKFVVVPYLILAVYRSIVR
jgi:hypothetical protein